MNNLDDFINMSKEEINRYFNGMSKESLIRFCSDNEIPCKVYLSRKSILTSLVEFIDSTMIYKRISNN